MHSIRDVTPTEKRRTGVKDVKRSFKEIFDILHSFKNTEAPSSCWTDEHDAKLVWKG
ncbi:MAG: hypothetical protein K0Q83_2537 [Deltaproteobacteria bacterium]|nr:hypothetical protein [Deltaproteobacteria bacterium]